MSFVVRTIGSKKEIDEVVHIDSDDDIALSKEVNERD